jgi:carbon storage regulator CsrA
MLVLSRRVGQSIVIKKEIVVRVVKVSGNRAFLAITAPRSVRVDREEIWLAKNRDRHAARHCRKETIEAGAPETRPSKCLKRTTSRMAAASIVRRAIPVANRVPADKEEAGATFTSSVYRLIAESRATGGPAIEFHDDSALDELGPELQLTFLFIIQELLHNACRHSKSKNVLLGIAQDDGCVCIQVQDWGIGFDPKSVQPHEQGLQRGLQGVQQLVRRLRGDMSIDSQQGNGTCVIVEVPLPREGESERQGRAGTPR